MMADQLKDAKAIHGELKELTIFDVLIVILKYKKMLISLIVAVSVIAAAIAFMLPDVYTGTVRILPPQQNRSGLSAVLGQLGPLSALSGIKDSNDIYVDMLKSRTIQDDLVQRFNLRKVYHTAYASDARLRLEKASRVLVEKGGVISISVSDTNPSRAAAIANAYIDELTKLTQINAVTEASKRRSFFEKQLISAKNDLTNAEMQLKQTQETTGLIQLNDQAQAIIKADIDLKAQIAAKQVQLTAMQSFATDQNPDYIRLQKELSGFKNQLAMMEGAHGQENGGLLLPTKKIPQAGLEYARNLRNVKYYEAIFGELAKQYELAKIDEAKEGTLIQVLDKANPPDKKSGPHRIVIIIMSALLATVFAVLLAFIRESIDKAKQNPEKQQQIQDIKNYAKTF